ncbi:MAG: hypothetical protein IKM00_06545 [Clostridia bacterium]|nr:hypothetical protein [Clostridia bacterium]
MEPYASSIVLTKKRKEGDVRNCFRLVRTFDSFCEADVFSVFLTTESEGACEEDFVYDISRDLGEAKSFFDLLCRNDASAVHLREIAEDFIADCREA